MPVIELGAVALRFVLWSRPASTARPKKVMRERSLPFLAFAWLVLLSVGFYGWASLRRPLSREETGGRRGHH